MYMYMYVCIYIYIYTDVYKSRCAIISVQRVSYPFAPGQIPDKDLLARRPTIFLCLSLQFISFRFNLFIFILFSC